MVPPDLGLGAGPRGAERLTSCPGQVDDMEIGRVALELLVTESAEEGEGRRQQMSPRPLGTTDLRCA